MSTETTLQTARKCPKCNNEGELIVKERTTNPKLTGHVYQCNNKVCPWYTTRWVVTVDDEDHVQTRDPGHDPKRFPPLPTITEAQRQRLLPSATIKDEAEE